MSLFAAFGLGVILLLAAEVDRAVLVADHVLDLDATQEASDEEEVEDEQRSVDIKVEDVEEGADEGDRSVLRQDAPQSHLLDGSVKRLVLLLLRLVLLLLVVFEVVKIVLINLEVQASHLGLVVANVIDDFLEHLNFALYHLFFELFSRGGR